MTPALETEYIINEDLLCRVERALKYSGKNELAAEFGAIRNCFVPEQDSHSASSDKVSLTDEEFTHIIHSLETRPGTCWLCESIKKKIAELRQHKKKESEQR